MHRGEETLCKALKLNNPKLAHARVPVYMASIKFWILAYIFQSVKNYVLIAIGVRTHGSQLQDQEKLLTR